MKRVRFHLEVVLEILDEDQIELERGRDMAFRLKEEQFRNLLAAEQVNIIDIDDDLPDDPDTPELTPHTGISITSTVNRLLDVNRTLTDAIREQTEVNRGIADILRATVLKPRVGENT